MSDAPARRRTLLPLQMAYALFLPVWFALSVAAVMGLANTDAWWALPALLAVGLYPVAALAAAVMSHLLWSRRPRAALRWNLLPLPWLLAGALLLAWIAADGGFSTSA